MVQLIKFGAKDFERAKALQDRERIDPINSDTLFRSAMYALLSARETYVKQKKIYDYLLSEGLKTPRDILERPDELSVIERMVMFGRKKRKYLYGLAEYWYTSDISETILKDIGDGRTKEFDIRNRIAKEAPGLGYKCASLLLNNCGYENVMIIDILKLKILYNFGYPIKPYEHKPKNAEVASKLKHHGKLGEGVYMDRGISSRKEYELYESFLRDLASKHDVTPYWFNQLTWAKESTLKKKNAIDQQLRMQF